MQSKILNNMQIQNLFLEVKNEIFLRNSDIYFDKLNNLTDKKNLSFELIITHPYWLYDTSEDNLILNKIVYAKYKDLISELSKKYPYVIHSTPQNHIQLEKLTYDKRHLRSNIYF